MLTPENAIKLMKITLTIKKIKKIDKLNKHQHLYSEISSNLHDKFKSYKNNTHQQNIHIIFLNLMNSASIWDEDSCILHNIANSGGSEDIQLFNDFYDFFDNVFDKKDYQETDINTCIQKIKDTNDDSLLNYVYHFLTGTFRMALDNHYKIIQHQQDICSYMHNTPLQIHHCVLNKLNISNSCEDKQLYDEFYNFFNSICSFL